MFIRQTIEDRRAESNKQQTFNDLTKNQGDPVFGLISPIYIFKNQTRGIESIFRVFGLSILPRTR